MCIAQNIYRRHTSSKPEVEIKSQSLCNRKQHKQVSGMKSGAKNLAREIKQFWVIAEKCFLDTYLDTFLNMRLEVHSMKNEK